MKDSRPRTSPPVEEREARFWFLIVARARELELRRRRSPGRWRMRCPVDDSHEATILNGTPGIAICCQGPTGDENAGHSLAVHLRRSTGWDRWEVKYPCRFCGCTESMVLAALGARSRDKFRQAEAARDGRCSCGVSGYRVGRLPVLCLPHLADHVGLDRRVLFA